jgi:hypothetical protein
MCAAVKQRASTTCGSNTRVVSDETGSHVYLHGHKIGKVAPDGTLSVNSCGWETVTTKSRLNALINCFTEFASDGIYQKDFTWWVRYKNVTKLFPSNSWYSFN